jgi:hypothetical protein
MPTTPQHPAPWQASTHALHAPDARSPKAEHGCGP